jgi:membrane-associated phospholipid phosphatase
MKKERKFDRVISKYHLVSLLLCVFSLLIFLKVLEDVLTDDSIVRLDLIVNGFMPHLWNSNLNIFMIFITNLMSPVTLISLSLILIAYIVYRKEWFNSSLFLFSLAFGYASEFIIKIFVHRARPENALLLLNDYSFPSGHATLAVILFLFLAYVLNNDIKNKVLRYTSIGLCVFSFLLVAGSRVYLNVHWISDVLAGLALGLFWFCFFLLILKSKGIKRHFSHLFYAKEARD